VSAFIVPDRHINLLIAWASREGVTYWWENARRDVRGDEQRCAAELFAANVRSVNFRYDESAPETGFTFAWQKWGEKLPEPIGILKGCDCYDYQACEVGDYRASEAWQIVDAIRGYAIRRLPGYDNAMGWAFEDAPATA
jgi:hypothetical protein